MKTNKENLKQFFMIFIAVFLILFGYLSYNYTNDTLEVASRNSNEINLGDVELVSSTPLEEIKNDNVIITGIVPNNESTDTNRSNISDNYFEETRIERDRMYSETIETYQKILDTGDISVEQKSVALQEISNVTTIKNGIIISENLIKNKGFEDVVILENNGKVNVIVKYPKLTIEQISQIQNIIQRQLNVSAENINISSK